MNIQKITTSVHPEFPNLIHVQIKTSDGIVGTGETYYFGSTVAHFIHEYVAPALVGKSIIDPDYISSLLTTYVGYNGSGVETRARSAVDIALWDIRAQAEGVPVYKLLGGTQAKQLKIYNTCAGTSYMRKSNQNSSSWGLDTEETSYQDLSRFMEDAGGLATELLAEGISAMKIWPFDLYAERTRGLTISDEDLELALQPIRDIRETVGSKMDIMIEMHALWHVEPAKKILNALKEFDIFWVEDPLLPDMLDEYSELRGNGLPKIAHGETVASKFRIKRLLEQNLIDFLTLDLGWCGGFTQGLLYSDLARKHGVQIAPHDCTGPIGLIAGSHLATAWGGTTIQETVRAALRTWYPFIVSDLPLVERGFLTLSGQPGLGTSLRPAYLKDPPNNVQSHSGL